MAWTLCVVWKALVNSPQLRWQLGFPSFPKPWGFKPQISPHFVDKEPVVLEIFEFYYWFFLSQEPRVTGISMEWFLLIFIDLCDIPPWAIFEIFHKSFINHSFRFVTSPPQKNNSVRHLRVWQGLFACLLDLPICWNLRTPKGYGNGHLFDQQLKQHEESLLSWLFRNMVLYDHLWSDMRESYIYTWHDIISYHITSFGMICVLPVFYFCVQIWDVFRTFFIFFQGRNCVGLTDRAVGFSVVAFSSGPLSKARRLRWRELDTNCFMNWRACMFHVCCRLLLFWWLFGVPKLALNLVIIHYDTWRLLGVP